MADLWTWLPPDGGMRVIVDCVWQTTLIGLLGWSALAFVRQPAARAHVAWLTIVACALVPLASTAGRLGGWGLLAPAGGSPLQTARSPHAQGAEHPPSEIAALPSADESRAFATAPVHAAPALDARARDAWAQDIGDIELPVVPAPDAPAPVVPAPDDLETVAAALAHAPGGASSPSDQQRGSASGDRPPLAGGPLHWSDQGPARTAARVLLWCWAAGVTIGLARLARGAQAARRTIAAATPIDDARLRAALQVAAERLRLAGIPRLVRSSAVATPTLVGWRRVTIVLPSDLPEQSEAAWVAVFCHELAHEKRRDPAARLVVELVLAVLFFQPLLWVLRRRHRAACEQACDDWTVASGSDPVELAAVLADWIPRRAPRLGLGLALGMAQNRSHARQRILRLLTLEGPPRPRLGRYAALTTVALMLAAVAALAILQPGARADDPRLAIAGEPALPVDDAPPREDQPSDADGASALEPEDDDKAAAAADVAHRADIEVLRERIAFIKLHHERIEALHAAGAAGGEPEKLAAAAYYLADARARLLFLYGQTAAAADLMQHAIEHARQYLHAAQHAYEAGTTTDQVLFAARDALDSARRTLASWTAPPVDPHDAHTAPRGATPTLPLPPAAPPVDGEPAEQGEGSSPGTRLFDGGLLGPGLQTRVPAGTTVYVGFDDRSPYSAPAQYRVAPPDVLHVRLARFVPRSGVRIEPLSTVHIEVDGTPPDALVFSPRSRTKGGFAVEVDGTVHLGPRYGRIKLAGMTAQEAEGAILEHLRNFLVDPHVAISLDADLLEDDLSGEYLIGPDDRISLGTYGSLAVGGLTVDEIRARLEEYLAEHLVEPRVAVTVFAYNSHVYYLIHRGSAGDSVHRSPLVGRETVLDALSDVEGLGDLRAAEIALVRITPEGPKRLEIDWEAIATGSSFETNHALRSGDRVFVIERAAGALPNGPRE